MKRSGKTETLSISLSAEPLKVFRRRARHAYRGNLSAAIAEAAEYLRREMALGDLVADLEREHGPLTDAERTKLEVELSSQSTRRRRMPAA